MFRSRAQKNLSPIPLSFSSLTSVTIKPVVLCFFQYKGKVLLEERLDPATQIPYYKPIGGDVHHGEYTWEAMRRVIREAIAEDIKNLSFIGPTENIFQVDQKVEHELIFLFEGEFVNRSLYKQTEVPVGEKRSKRSRFVWKHLSDIMSNRITLYPEGLAELLGK